MKNMSFDEAMRAMEKRLAEKRLFSYDPYDWQRNFHNAGTTCPERMLSAANRCISQWTPVETASGERLISEMLGEEDVAVRSWDGESRCVAQAGGVFVKGIEPMFRVLTDRGFFDCSYRHRVLTRAGWLSLGQIVQRSSGLRLTGIDAGCWGDFHEDGRSDGQRPRRAGDIVPEQPPSEGGVHTHSQTHGRRDAGGQKPSHIRAYPETDPRTTTDDPDQIEALCARFVNPGDGIDALRKSATHQDVLQFRAEVAQRGSAFGSRHRRPFSPAFSEEQTAHRPSGSGLVAPEAQLQEIPRFGSWYAPGDVTRLPSEIAVYPLSHDPLVGGGHIVAVVPIGLQPVLDATVEVNSSYWSGGVIHHNTGKTFSAGREVAMHLTGLYPDWWEGRRFEKPVKAWAGSQTNEMSRDIVQAELIGGVGDKWGTGAVPKDTLVGRPSMRNCGIRDVIDTFHVKHSSGGTSSCTLKTYEQGWKRWQGQAPDVVWMDEEPDDYMVYSEAQTRILSSNGIILITFTPLSGVTELVAHYLDASEKDGIFMLQVGWDRAPHLDKDARDRLSRAYRPHERDARTKGVPMLGEGAVFPIDENKVACTPIQIPDFWWRIKGCDFGGMDHPAAGVELAWDNANDIVYVVDCYKEKGVVPIHAAWFNKTRRWVPVAWPHDGINRERQGGVQLKDVYADHGVNMMANQAHYKPPYGKKPKMGAQPLEPVVQEMYERMMNGRLRAFVTCDQWFEEMRGLHRKDGKIVDRRDDIMKATMYAMMMLRFGLSEKMASGDHKRRVIDHAVSSVA